jgi:quaternary ammonium compound-resistance protein SugE
VGYSVWVGLGIVGVAALDIFVYGEPTSPPKLLCIFMILLGTIGLKVIT